MAIQKKIYTSKTKLFVQISQVHFALQRCSYQSWWKIDIACVCVCVSTCAIAMREVVHIWKCENARTRWIYTCDECTLKRTMCKLIYIYIILYSTFRFDNPKWKCAWVEFFASFKSHFKGRLCNTRTITPCIYKLIFAFYTFYIDMYTYGQTHHHE